MKWTITKCEDCEGTGWAHLCSYHAEPCEHDRLCRRCRGEGEHPEKAIVLFGVSMGEYRTRQDAWYDIIGIL